MSEVKKVIKGDYLIKKTNTIILVYALTYTIISILVAMGRLAISSRYLLSLNIASLVFALAQFLDCGIKNVIWLCNKTYFRYLFSKTKKSSSNVTLCVEKRQLRKIRGGLVRYEKLCKRMNKSFDNLNDRTEKLRLNSFLANWIYLSSPAALALLIIFSEPLSLAMSDNLISASAILPLGFLFMNMFLDNRVNGADIQFLSDAVVDIYAMEQAMKCLNDQINEKHLID